MKEGYTGRIKWNLKWANDEFRSHYAGIPVVEKWVTDKILFVRFNNGSPIAFHKDYFEQDLDFKDYFNAIH